MHLTCNQLMLLLALYRGSDVDLVSCGTTEADMHMLAGAGYVSQHGDLTHAGMERVAYALH